jgi:hypothetical protein
MKEVFLFSDVFTAEVEEIAELKKELKDLKEIDKEFMTKVLSKLEIQAENAAMQSQKITKLDTVETSLENLSVVVSRQGKSLNDTAVLLNDHTFQITNLTKRFERLAQAPEDEEDEGHLFLLCYEKVEILFKICTFVTLTIKINTRFITCQTPILNLSFFIIKKI